MISLSLPEFDIVSYDYGYGPIPRPLTVPSIGKTDRERVQLKAEVYAGLNDRGLAVNDVPNSTLREYLKIVGKANTLLECEAITDRAARNPLRAVAAVYGDQGVRITQHDDLIAITPIRDNELYSSIVDLLPPLSAGPGSAIRVSVAELAAASALPAESIRTANLRAAMEIQSRPVVAAGQLTLRRRDRQGTIINGTAKSWFLTDRGAYIGDVDRDARGGWLTVQPVDSANLSDHLAR